MKKNDFLKRAPIDDDPPKPKGNPGILSGREEDIESDEIEEIDKTE